MSKNRAARDELLSLAGSPQPNAPALDQPRCREAPADSHPGAAAEMPWARLSRKFLLYTGLSEPCFNFRFNSLL